MATFRNRKGKWQARIQGFGGPSQTRTFYKLSDAKYWAQQIEASYQRGEIETTPTPITLTAAFERYLREINSKKKRAAIESYRIQAWIRNSLGQRRLHEIKTQHLASWRDEKIKLGFQPNTIRLHLAVLSHLYTVAQSEWGYEALKNPVLSLSRPKLKPPRESRISDQEVFRLIEHTNSVYLPTLILLALATAMRRSELIKLQWEDIDWQQNLIHVQETKNGENRVIPLTQNLKEILLAIGIGQGRIFPIQENAVTLAFYRSVKRAGIANISFHTLRHEAITRFFEMGLTIPEVASISGHKSWSMLSRYTHMDYTKIIKKIDLPA